METVLLWKYSRLETLTTECHPSAEQYSGVRMTDVRIPPYMNVGLAQARPNYY